MSESKELRTSHAARAVLRDPCQQRVNEVTATNRALLDALGSPADPAYAAARSALEYFVADHCRDNHLVPAGPARDDGRSLVFLLNHVPLYRADLEHGEAWHVDVTQTLRRRADRLCVRLDEADYRVVAPAPAYQAAEFRLQRLLAIELLAERALSCCASMTSAWEFNHDANPDSLYELLSDLVRGRAQPPAEPNRDQLLESHHSLRTLREAVGGLRTYVDHAASQNASGGYRFDAFAHNVDGAGLKRAVNLVLDLVSPPDRDAGDSRTSG